MAASAESKDYVHLVTKALAEKSGAAPEVMVKNIADFERAYADYDFAAKQKEAVDFHADLIILAIGYYITPELVGGTEGVFISRYIAYHISTSLNWGLAAALGTILLAAVLLLYYVYDKIVGIDNVKLG